MMVYVTILFLLRYTHYMTIIGPAFLGILIGYIVNVCVISILWTMALFPRVYVKLSGHAVTLLAKLHIVKNKEKTLAAWTIQVEGFTKEDVYKRQGDDLHTDDDEHYLTSGDS